jgi:hypothetical protein
VEVLAGAKSATMQEANGDMQFMDLAARPELAESRSEHRLRCLRDVFVGCIMTQMDVSKDTALQMQEPACVVLKAQRKQWIDEGIAELEELILEAEEWHVDLANATCGAAPPKRSNDEDEADGGGLGGSGLGSIANILVASVEVLRHRNPQRGITMYPEIVAAYYLNIFSTQGCSGALFLCPPFCTWGYFCCCLM